MDQTRAPLFDALEAMRDERIVPFDVPGHKHGKGNKPLMDFLGERCLSVDVNSMKPLDNLCHPVSVIKEAEGAGGGCFRCGARVFYGWGHDLGGAGDDAFHFKKRR